MRWALRIFGITVIELIREEPELLAWVENTGGSFEIADGDEPEYEYEEDLGFGFRSPQ